MNITFQTRRSVLFVCLLFVITTTQSQPVHAQDGTITVSLVPISADGMHTIMGNKISLSAGGQRVFFELRYYDWKPKLLHVLVIALDSSGYSNGIGAPLGPATHPCTENADCEEVFVVGAPCVLPNTPRNVTGEFVCRAAFFTPGREDGIPPENGGPFAITTPITATLDFIFGSATIADPSKSDPGFDVYGGTLVLDIPSDASGRYLINRIPLPESYAQDDAHNDIPIIFLPAIIELPAGCCLPQGTCQGNTLPSNCEAQGGTVVGPCIQRDCNHNGVFDVCDLALEISVDCDQNNQIDSCEIFNDRSLDCNFSFTLDKCDLAEGTSSDCNSNDRPDECDIADDLMNRDCNGNGILDSCELARGLSQDCNGNNVIDACEQLDNVAGDCNGNGVLDECDLATGTSPDLDGNCLPDECNPFIAPLAEPNGVLKSRYISFIPVNAGCNTAIRVKLVSLYHPAPTMIFRPDISAFEGEVRWVGPPVTYPEGSELSWYTFNGAELQCEPFFTNWSSVGLLHVFGSAIVPDSIYEIEMVDAGCPDLNDPSCYTDLLEVRTGRWGDIIEPFNPPSNTAQPSIMDVLSIVDKWLGFLNPIKASAQLQANIPNPWLRVNMADVNRVVDAWLGRLYHFTGPESCNP